MRISIWQEFSSNHSARFTVVGVFESAERASRAAAELMDVVKTIIEWYARPENADALEGWRESGDQPPSPPEVQFAQRYGVEWSDRSLDWLWLDDRGNGPVRAYENLVFVNGTESWLGSRPADALVEKLGGQALVDGSIIVYGEETDLWGEISVTLTCTAPDETAAQAISDEVMAYVDLVKQDHNRMFDTPWSGYHTRFSISSFDGSVRRDGRKLIFERASFFHIADGLPALMAYLKDKGCTDIQYVLAETRRGYDDPFEPGE